MQKAKKERLLTIINRDIEDPRAADLLAEIVLELLPEKQNLLKKVLK
jgi:hypothetical protein